MSDTDLKQRKRQLRAAIREQLGTLSMPTMKQWSHQITERIINLDEYTQAETIMVYLSLATEFRTDELITHALAVGKTICAPNVDWDSGKMTAAPLETINSYYLDSKGLKQPASKEKISPKDIDLILVPGLAFDRRGHRLGRGGGYYDRFLPLVVGKICTLSAAYEFQVVEEVPAGPKDQPVDLIVTPGELIRVE